MDQPELPEQEEPEKQKAPQKHHNHGSAAHPLTAFNISPELQQEQAKF
jgi:hypothetical protein